MPFGAVVTYASNAVPRARSKVKGAIRFNSRFNSWTNLIPPL